MTPAAVRMRALAKKRGGWGVMHSLANGKASSVDAVTAARTAKPAALRSMMVNAQTSANVQLQIALYALAAICTHGTFFTYEWAQLIVTGKKCKELRNNQCCYLNQRRLIITKDPSGRGRLALGVVVFKDCYEDSRGWRAAHEVPGACVDKEGTAKLIAQRSSGPKGAVKKLPAMWVWEFDITQMEVFTVPIGVPNDGSQTTIRLDKYDCALAVEE